MSSRIQLKLSSSLAGVICFALLMTVAACSSKTFHGDLPGVSQELGDLSQLDGLKLAEGTEMVQCGTNFGMIEYRTAVLEPFSKDTQLFGILSNGSPATDFFSDYPEQQRFAIELLKKGYKLIEYKYSLPPVYQQEGFYALCYQQGLQNVIRHTGQIYDFAVKTLGYQENHSDHKLIGVGWSLGALKLEAMAFVLGKKFHQLALTGVLWGDVEKGCTDGALAGHGNDPSKFNGWGWGYFIEWADVITLPGKSCEDAWKSGTPSEYNAQLNFNHLPFANRKDLNLGMFEGKKRYEPYNKHFVGGNDQQVNFIEGYRKSVHAPVKKYLYDGCGHEVFQCSQGKMTKDMLNFLN